MRPWITDAEIRENVRWAVLLEPIARVVPDDEWTPGASAAMRRAIERTASDLGASEGSVAELARSFAVGGLSVVDTIVALGAVGLTGALAPGAVSASPEETTFHGIDLGDLAYLASSLAELAKAAEALDTHEATTGASLLIEHLALAMGPVRAFFADTN